MILKADHRTAFSAATSIFSRTLLTFKSINKCVLSLLTSLVITLLMVSSANAQTQFWSDTFEDTGAPSSGTRTPSINTGFASPSSTPLLAYYFIRTDGSNLALQAPFSGLGDTFTAYQNMQGSKFWAGEDTDQAKTGTLNTADKVQQIEWTDIDIAGKTGLSFKGLFAANRNQGWQNPTFGSTYDFLIVEYKIDAGAWTRLGGFNVDVTATNAGYLKEDTNGDNYGDGTALYKTFSEFTWNIIGTGTTMSLRFRASADAASTQEFAIDNFRLLNSGTNTGPAATTGNVEYFEGATANSQIFNNSTTALGFTLTNKFFIQNEDRYGVQSANPPTTPATGSNFYIDNFANQATNQVNSIKSTNKALFKVKSLWAYPSSLTNGSKPSNDGTLTFTGKKNGATVYTFTKSGIFQTAVNLGANYNGFTYIDFSVGTDNSNTLIDELEISLSSAYKYLALDNFAFAATPSIVNVAATPITTATAVIKANVNPSASATSAISFDYSTSPTLASGVTNVTATPSTLASANTATSVSAGITGLAAGTTYYYRAKATNTLGTNNNSVILSFTTSAPVGVLLSTSPTIHFSNSTGFGDHIAEDGEGGSTAISDINIQTYPINSSAVKITGSPLTYYDSNSPGWPNYPAIISYGDVDAFYGWVIKSSDGSNFSLASLNFLDWGDQTGKTFKIEAFDGGSSKGSLSFVGNTNVDFKALSQTSGIPALVLPAAFGNVDEVRVYQADRHDSYIALNDVKVGTAVVPPTNTAPTNIALSATSINENVAAASTVGTLSATDTEGGTMGYTLVSGTGDTDNSAFTLTSAGSLSINASPDFETKSSYSVRVKVTDAGNLSFEKALTIAVNNMNEAPTALALSTSSINENVAAGSTVGTLATTDADAANTFTYTLVAGEGSTDNAAFSVNSNSLKINASPNFETKNSYSVRIKTTDQGGLSFEKIFTITINDVCELDNGITVTSGVMTANQSGATYQWIQCPVTILVGENGQSYTPTAVGSYAVVVTVGTCSTLSSCVTVNSITVNTAPTALALSATSVDHGAAANTIVGALTSTDPDASDTFTYTLVAGIGDTDNAAFNINGSNLRITNSSNYLTKNSYSIRLRTTDQGGLTFEKTFTVTVNNVNAAPVAYADSYTVNYGGTVTVVSPNVLTNDVEPENSPLTAVLVTGPTNGTLTLNTNGTFNYVHNGTNTTSDSFTYRANDGTLNSNIATVTLTINAPIVTVSSINRVGAAVTNVTVVNYTVTFSVPVTGVDASDFTLTKTGSANGTIGTPTGSGNTWTVPVNSITGEGTLRLDFTSTTGVSPNVSATYLAGQEYTIDHTAPTLSSGSYYSNNGFSSQYAKVGNIITLVIGFNEPLQSINMVIAGNAVTSTASNGNKNWSATYTLTTGDTEGNVPWSYNATDLAGNVKQQSNTDFGTFLSFDKTGPVVNITPSATIAAPGANVDFNIAYVDPSFSSSSLSSNNITVNSTGTASYTSLTLTGSGNAYVATLNGVSGFGTLGISIAAGTAIDIPGNTAEASAASPTALIASNNADLSVLTTTATGLAPTFSSTIVAYTATVLYATTSTTITATKAQAGATLQVSVNGGTYAPLASGAASGALALNVGANTITILVTAENGITNKLYTLTVNRVNVAPTDLALSVSSINENVVANSTFGTLSTTDPDVGNTFTYSLVVGTGDTDNAAFNISGNNLTITASPDFETKSSYSVRIRTTDQGGLFFEKEFTITINNLNEVPTAIALSASSINENVAAGSTVGTLSTTDVDASNTFTYTLVAGTGDTDNAAFTISGNSLTIKASPDFETKSSYSLRMRTADQGGLVFEKEFTITINNLNEVPTAIALSASSINENVAAGSTVGTLSTIDVDASNTFTYALVAGTGDTDNAAFTISGNSLTIKASPDFETKSSYSVRMRTTDQGGLLFEKELTITINDVTELVFTTTSLPNAKIAASYSQQINVTVGASPYTFAITTGALPAGLSLSSTGSLSGTPTEGGSFNFNVTATDQNSVSASYAYSLTVGAPTLALTASLTNGTVGTAYSQTLATTGGISPYTYAITAGALPPGLTLSSAGAITGTPTTGGTSNFTVKATDASIGTGPFSATIAYTLVINPTVQTITFNATRTATYGDADLAPAATSTNSSIDITYTSSDPTIATIVSGKVHLVKAGTVTISANQAANASYSLAVQKQQTLTINPKTLTVALTGTISKTYDNSSIATLSASNFSLSGKVGADDVSIAAPITGAYANENVGTGKLVTVNSLALAGTTQANYQLALTTVNAAIGVIQVKPITLSLNASPLVTKVYDRTTLATLVAQNYSLVGIESGDVVTVEGIADYNDKTVATGKTISAHTFVLGGVDKNNYSLTTTSAATTGAITAKPITVALNASPAITKVYDATNSATLVAGNYNLVGLVGSDMVVVTGTTNYNNKIVGTGKTVTANNFVLGGADKDNYSLTTSTATTTGSITAKPITVALNASPAITKVYDATNSATLVAGNYNLSGLQGSDVVSVTGTATYSNKTVGTGKAVAAGSFVLAGADKGNYSLTTTSAATTGTITAQAITVALNASPAITKVYNGNTSATLVADNYTLTGVQASDIVVVTGTTNYNNKIVGTGKTVTANNFVLGGADKNNYSLTTISAATTGAITAKPITVALNASPAITKVYDATNSATLVAGNYNLVGLVGSDIVTVTGTTNYDNAIANIGKTISTNAFVLAGIDKDNYNLTTTTATTTGVITKASLVITAENKTRVQNTPDPVFTASYAGFVNSETSAVLTNQPTFSTTATISSLQGDYLIVPAGAAATNYNISYVNGKLTVIPGSPTSITLAQSTLFENRPAGTHSGTLSSTSDDPNATFTFTLVSGTGNTDNNLFAIVGSQLNTASSLDYEQKASYSIRVRSTTQYGISLDRVLTIALNDVNERPTLNDIANQILCADGDRKTISLTGISAGPEIGQITSLTVASNNASLFSELSVSTSGVLTYKTANGKSGTATVTVTVKDNGGVDNGGIDNYSRSFTITINPLPIANITTDGAKVSLSKGERLILRASGGATYNWANAPGIIGTRNSNELTIRPETTTTYTVEVISASGCSITKSITISVADDFMVVKGTNLLTPNGDGKNDRFVIRNIDMYPNNEVKIYDRAGRLLFSKVNYTDEFDGTFKGSPLAEDTYYYIVDFGPTKLKLKGFITIVRD